MKTCRNVLITGACINVVGGQWMG